MTACWIIFQLLISNFKIWQSLNFIYSEKATKFCEIFTLLLSYVVPVKSKVKISQNFVAFSEYMNFKASVVCASAQWESRNLLSRILIQQFRQFFSQV